MEDNARQAVVIWDYDAREDNEITLVAGEKIKIIELCNEVNSPHKDWYEGTTSQQSGLFPANHVKLVESSTISFTQLLSDQQSINSDKESNALHHDSGLNTWSKVSTDGSTYYWNEETGETSWTLPIKDTLKTTVKSKHLSKIPSFSPSQLALLDTNKKHRDIGVIPAGLINREGMVSYRIKKDCGGIEPKKKHSWHLSWAIVCVGYLILYKEDPIKLRKKINKPVIPLYVLLLESMMIQIEPKDGNRKNIVSLKFINGNLILLNPQPDESVDEWLEAIVECTLEKSSVTEKSSVAANDNMVSMIFANSNPTKSRDKVVLIQGQHSSKVNDDVSNTKDVELSKTKIKSKIQSIFKKVVDLRLDHGNKEAKVIPNGIFFGANLEDLAKVSNRNIPMLFERLVDYIQNSGGVEMEGIYRLSGNASTVLKFREQLNQSIRRLMRCRFRFIFRNNGYQRYSSTLEAEIQIPLIPFVVYDQFVDAIKIVEYNDRLCAIKTLVQELPVVHYEVLQYLINHLVLVSDRSDVNKMDPNNLAIVFGPSLIRMPAIDVNDMQAAVVNMMKMSQQNAIVEALIVQSDVFNHNLVDIRWKVGLI